MLDYDNKEKKINLSFSLASEKIRRWCAFQERSHFETRNKLFEYGLNSAEVDQLMAELISENFLNEERFAESFARGKFRIKHWGRIKIKLELKKRKVSDYSINKALGKIDETEYLQVLSNLISKKNLQIKEKDSFKKRYKLAQYAIGRGFENDLINDIIQLNLND